jgi:purine-binding chemotaxis protein CheW
MTRLVDVSEEHRQLLEVKVADQTFGIPLLLIREVLGPRKVSLLPLAPPSVGGALNLRGRVVTAIETHTCLGLPRPAADSPTMSVIVAHQAELYSLTIDAVGEVLNDVSDAFEPNPATLDARWREFAAGIVRLDGRLTVVLDVERFLDAACNSAAGPQQRRLAAA